MVRARRQCRDCGCAQTSRTIGGAAERSVISRLGALLDLPLSGVGVMFTQGNGIGGGAGTAGASNGSNALGFSASPAFAANSSFLTTFPLTGNNNAFPAYAPPQGRAFGPAFGTGFTTTTGYTGTPQTVAYYDPYLGGRAPQYINWSFGFQHQWTEALTSSISYVGSQRHFFVADASNARGFWANQPDPKFLAYNTSTTNNLGLSGAPATAFCQANHLPCPANFTSSQNIATALRPFPFQGVTDCFWQCCELQLPRSSDAVEYARLPWNDVHGYLNLVAFHRQWWHLPVRLGHPSSVLREWQGVEARPYRALCLNPQPAASYGSFTGVWDMPFGRTVFAGNAWSRPGDHKSELHPQGCPAFRPY